MVNHPEQTARFIGTKKEKILFSLLVFVGILCMVLGYWLYPENHHQRFWANVLLNQVLFTGIALGSLFFLALQYTVNVGWSVGLKRIPEAVSGFLPLGGILMLFFLFFGGIYSLYHWSHETQDPILLGKSAYLNETSFVLRSLLYFVLWSFFWFILRRYSIREDHDPETNHYTRSRKYSIIFLIVFALTVTTSSFDWIMSIDAHWFSTMFGVYHFSGIFFHSIAVLTLIAFWLKRRNLLPHINENHFHDLGKMVFAFSTFWVYIWFFQFMLIWYANIPEETQYYLLRLEFPWNILFYSNVGINWLVPFLVLMSRSAKRNPRVLQIVCWILVGGYWLELYGMIFPSSVKELQFGFLELGTFLAYLGLFLISVSFFLTRASLVAKHHPLLEESLGSHT